MEEENEKFLAILVFNKDYKRLPKLPGVEDDEKELTKSLKKYKKELINNSENVLNSLKDSVEYFNEEKKKFERVHFHFSGHGQDVASVWAEENKDTSDLLVAQGATGECVLGIGHKSTPSSIHDIKVELNKLDAEKITITLDCCRNDGRSGGAVVDLKAKEKITAKHQEKMFIFYGTLETLTAEDNKGRTFSQILSSVCEEYGGAVNILEIEKKVNEKMSEKKMEQKITATRVVGNGNWEDYMWPHQIDKNAEPLADNASKAGTVTHNNYNYGRQGLVMSGGRSDNLTISM